MLLIGVIGKPSCGKSTLFKALTLADVEISPRIFTTIKPNRAVGFVKAKCPEEKIKAKCKPNLGFCKDGTRFVPVELLDVAGLVPGAHEGKGLGNKFLDDLRQADAFIHVIDISGSSNENGEPVEKGSYDPANDIRFLEEEIGYWFFGLMKKNWAKFSKEVEMQKRELIESLVKQFSGLKITEPQIKKAIETTRLPKDTPAQWSDEDLRKFAFELRKLSKRMIIAANKIDVPGSEKNLERLRKEFPGYTIIPCSAESELALKEADKHSLIKYTPGEKEFEILKENELSGKQKQALEFVKDLLAKFRSTGVQECLDKAVFDLLDYIVAYPVANINKLTDSKGNVLPDAILVPKGTNLREFAGKVHTEMADKFIGGVDFQTKRKLGADYEVKDGEIIEIVLRK
ncbi:MAG: redox-regulated ATPase YchF [Candidatus Aenigmarchaeota archaeon]|nr:redox-regulated ATPase YchF [Candidatus Aenigmarchaeota archaeon]NIP41034.1 redox-regulated ATPase YchF [Candidatus Aenigmarchaeota archaeon]NIQ17436.1 redox-regulated ATPase YchF [Candidatus Aenigmarchaeota archaeon]NIS73630.1 redox-regulated ATPase YchF [Candidatus Aenigmarchaeota archaeon]